MIIVSLDDVRKDRTMPYENFCAWDIEIAGTLEHPEGITCAATYTSGGENAPMIYHGPTLIEDGRITEVMLPSDLKRMLNDLRVWEEQGYPIVSWNGVGFDWRVLASFMADPQDKKLCATLALQGYDPGFHFFCAKGFMPGLNKVCRAMGVKGKLEGMDGVQAIEKWKEDRPAQELVLKYVQQDAIATADAFRAIRGAGKISWITRSERLRHWTPNDRQILKAGQALASLPVPDNSWMDDPWTRDKFVGWIEELGVL